MRGVSKRGGEAPSLKSLPSPLRKGRGIKGERLTYNLLEGFEGSLGKEE